MTRDPTPHVPPHAAPPGAPRLDRRRFLASTGLAGVALAAPAARPTAARAQDADAHVYGIVRTEAEWRERLTIEEFRILRGGSTELPRSSDLWNETRPGAYACRGCDLKVYDSNWKVPLDKGWAFFAHGEPDAILMGIDGPQEAYGMDPDGPGAMIEAHCRRCGSHLGHILLVAGEVLHCINGRALAFAPRAA